MPVRDIVEKHDVSKRAIGDALHTLDYPMICSLVEKRRLVAVHVVKYGLDALPSHSRVLVWVLTTDLVENSQFKYEPHAHRGTDVPAHTIEDQGLVDQILKCQKLRFEANVVQDDFHRLRLNQRSRPCRFGLGRGD